MAIVTGWYFSGCGYYFHTNQMFVQVTQMFEGSVSLFLYIVYVSEPATIVLAVECVAFIYLFTIQKWYICICVMYETYKKKI